MPLILVRHGQTEFNLTDKLQGSLDSPLTEKGLMQANKLGKALAKVEGIEDYKFYSSPQNRALRTSDIIKSYLTNAPEFLVDIDLREVSFGDWEGKTSEELKGKGFDPNISKRMNWAKNCETGETIENGLMRANAAIEKFKNGNNLLVSHGAMISMIRGINLQLPIETMMDLPINQDCYWVINNGKEIEIHAL